MHLIKLDLSLYILFDFNNIYFFIKNLCHLVNTLTFINDKANIYIKEKF